MGLVVVPALFITALIFFTLLGAALIYPKSWWGKLLAICIVLSPLVWLTWDIPVGYVRYKRACKEDAGFKVYAENFSLAKRIRLVDNAWYPEALFDQYVSVKQVEAEYRKVSNIKPTPYAVYERDDSGQLVSVLMDKIIETRQGIAISESAPSRADYFVEKKVIELPYRLTRMNYTLRDGNHQIVAEIIYYIYHTSNPDRSIGWTSLGCGPDGTDDVQFSTLLSLIASER